MKEWLSDAYLAKLNAASNSGVLFKAAILVVDGSTTLYFADVQDPITFDGQQYTPRPMQWEGLGQNSSRDLGRVTVTVSNVDGQVGSFLETTNLRGQPVTLQLLHEDLLATVTDVDTLRLQIVLCTWNDQQAVFTLARNLGLNAQSPRHVITLAEYPGTPDNIRRASIL